jgi:lysophospholipase L1-like esterase
MRPSVSNQTRDTQDDVLRVAPDDYRRNLEQLVACIREIGARPILMTAPRNHKLTAALVHNKQAASVEAAMALHDQYNAICRDVAREHEVLLLDLAKDFERDDLRQWFTRDGIHFQDEGRIYIANALYTLIHDDAQLR